MKSSIFWDIMSCSLLKVSYACVIKKETSKKQVTRKALLDLTDYTVLHPKDGTLQNHHYETLQSYESIHGCAFVTYFRGQHNRAHDDL
jgi:hypothetical protein